MSKVHTGNQKYRKTAVMGRQEIKHKHVKYTKQPLRTVLAAIKEAFGGSGELVPVMIWTTWTSAQVTKRVNADSKCKGI